MAACTIPAVELCPNCGREWPVRFGAHNCNHSRRYVHNNARIIQPGAPLRESFGTLADRLIEEANRSAEYADLGGEDSPYPAYLADIDATIGFLKKFRAEMQSISKHVHIWDDDDYCRVCGKDGRA